MNSKPAAFALAAILAVPALSRADDAKTSAHCSVVVVHALAGAGGIDPAIAKLKLSTYLEKSPFDAWKSFKLLSADERDIKQGGVAKYPLPQSRSASVSYLGAAEGASKKNAVRIVFSVEGGGPTAKTTLKLDDGFFWIHMGGKYEKGTLIYALRCSTAK